MEIDVKKVQFINIIMAINSVSRYSKINEM